MTLNGDSSMSQPEDDFDYIVVVNQEEQYSLWPSFRDLPPGWRSAGFTGKKQACLEHINEVWRDMRPLSLRQRMAAQA